MTGTRYKKTIKQGEVIFKEGMRGDCAYLIDEGVVELRAGHEDTPVGTVGVGEIFGEMAIIDGSPRAATAIAMTDVELSVVSKEQLNERINDADPVVRLLITMYLNRIRKSFNKNFNNTNKTSITNIKSFGMNFLSKTDVKTDEQVIEKIRFERELKEALDNNEYSMHFQPIIDIKTQEIAGLEALVRWQSPDRGMVRPDIFMGIAEETSLIVPLGRWIIQRACREFAQLREALKKASGDIPEMFVSINVSGRQIGDPKFFDVLQKATWSNKLKPKNIKLEITERVLVNGEFVFNWIKKVRQLGYSIALDDFGTGYSSLSYLSHLDVNNIKIDKSFVQAMENDKSTMTIVEFIVNMSHGLNRPVVAEGIETESQYKILYKMGCKYAQGYLFAKPMPMADVIKHMTGGKVAKKKAA